MSKPGFSLMGQTREKLHRRRQRGVWQRITGVLAGVVVFATVYALMLPAITITRAEADVEPGMVVGEIEDVTDGVFDVAA